MRLSIVLLLAGALSIAACGDEAAPEPPPTPAAEIPATTAEPPADGERGGSPDVPARPAESPEPAIPGSPRPGDGDAARGEQLYTVQVAAFTREESARLWTDRLSGHGLPVWTSVEEVGGRTFYRVRVGAAPTVAEARQLGETLSERYQWPVWVAPMTGADRPPAEAVETTRRLTGTS